MTEGLGSQGTEGSGTEVLNSSPAQTTAPQGGDQQGSQQPASNPAWDPFLADLPEYFHPKAKEHFSKWDENYRSLETQHKEMQDKYKPYEPYLGVNPNNLQSAMNVFQALNNDPKKVYDLLTAHVKQLGLLPDVPETPKTEGEFLEQQEDPRFADLDKRTKSLDERQARMDEFVQKQQYQQQVSTYENQIDKQVQELVGKFGDAVDVEDVMQRMFVQINSGQPFNAEKAFDEQKATFQRLYQRQAGGRPAPNIIPTNGTPAPSSEVKPENMNEDQRKAYFKHLLDVANAGG